MMHMAADSNMSFGNGFFPPSFCNQNGSSFHPGAVNCTAHGGFNSLGGINNSTGTLLAGDPDTFYNGSSVILDGNPNDSNHIDLLSGLKHDTGLAADWSYKEQALLRHGLIKYVDQPSVMKYIKIAALLPEKSVRDVALRSQWMSRKENGKRRKLDEYYAEKRCKDRKEQKGDPSTNVNVHPFGNMVGYPFMAHPLNNSSQFPSEAPILDIPSQQLLEENVQFLNQIASNIKAVKIQDNASLFLRTRNNFTSILNSMHRAPGIMSQMPPLPVTVSEDILTSILPTCQGYAFSAQAGSTAKQYPRC